MEKALYNKNCLPAVYILNKATSKMMQTENPTNPFSLLKKTELQKIQLNKLLIIFNGFKGRSYTI